MHEYKDWFKIFHVNLSSMHINDTTCTNLLENIYIYIPVNRSALYLTNKFFWGVRHQKKNDWSQF